MAFAGVAAKETEWFSTEPAQSAGLSQILNDVTGTTVWGTILAAGAVISIFSVTLVTLYGQTRILFAIGRDGLISRRFTKVHPRTLTPTFTTIVASVVIALIAGFVPADYLWDTVSIGTLVAFSAVAAGVMILRRTHPDLERPFRVPGYPVTPVLTILICGWIVIKLPVLTWMVFLGWLAVVVAFYLVYGRRHAALNTPDDPEDFAESRGDEEDERV